jgi:transposase-like protein
MTLEKDADVLLMFFDFPAEHWKHLRTSNVVEPPFATARTTCRSCAQIVLARRVQLIGGG